MPEWTGWTGFIVGTATSGFMLLLSHWLGRRRALEPHAHLLWQEQAKIWEPIIVECHACINGAVSVATSSDSADEVATGQHLDNLYHLSVRAHLFLDAESLRLIRAIEVQSRMIMGRVGAGNVQEERDELAGVYNQLLANSRDSLGAERLNDEIVSMLRRS